MDALIPTPSKKLCFEMHGPALEPHQPDHAACSWFDWRSAGSGFPQLSGSLPGPVCAGLTITLPPTRHFQRAIIAEKHVLRKRGPNRVGQTVRTT
ncbi:MAG: hypothetical protein K8I60_03385, partial [Anaerolineae bacterium]|nr:hypothetical protein [Anaerolineae bacterium]